MVEDAVLKTVGRESFGGSIPSPSALRNEKMSMNLCFETKDGFPIDFPFQTCTELTYSVLKATTVEEKIKLIKAEVDKWETDQWWKDHVMKKIEKQLNDPNLKLTMM